MVCLDTNFIIHLLRNDSTALEKLKSLSGESICTTSISVPELYRGAWLSNNRERERAKIRKILDNMKVISFDDFPLLRYFEINMLFSVLIDADRINASRNRNSETAKYKL